MHTTIQADAARQALGTMLPRGVSQGATDDPECPRWTVFVALAAIPEADIAAGDLLAYRHFAGRPVGAAVRPVPRALLRTVGRHADRLSVIASCAPDDQAMFDRVRFRRWRRGWDLNLRACDDTSPLVVIRPLRSPASNPIAAPSDDAAIFELLAQLGCAMPRAD